MTAADMMLNGDLLERSSTISVKPLFPSSALRHAQGLKDTAELQSGRFVQSVSGRILSEKDAQSELKGLQFIYLCGVNKRVS